MFGRKAPVNHLRSWLLYVCSTFVLLTIIKFFVQHIPGMTNNIADALSHFQHHCFSRMALNANLQPGIIPAWLHQAFITASCSADIIVLPSQLGTQTNPV